jgi:RNA polymerase sigma factor (sigma-70 family)
LIPHGDFAETKCPCPPITCEMPSDPHAPEPPDRDLLTRAAAGDRDAFGEIYRRHHHIVYRFSRAMTGCPTAAEDITQEAFVAVFADLARYDAARSSFTTYLYGIVRNLSRERLRLERRFFSLEVLSARSERATYRDDPGDLLEGAEVAAQIRHALQRLPPRYRELILLCDVHGLSYTDAAAVIRVSTAAVRSRLHRGRYLLRRRLARFATADTRRRVSPERCTT